MNNLADIRKVVEEIKKKVPDALLESLDDIPKKEEHLKDCLLGVFEMYIEYARLDFKVEYHSEGEKWQAYIYYDKHHMEIVTMPGENLFDATMNVWMEYLKR